MLSPDLESDLTWNFFCLEPRPGYVGAIAVACQESVQDRVGVELHCFDDLISHLTRPRGQRDPPGPEFGRLTKPEFPRPLTAKGCRIWTSGDCGGDRGPRKVFPLGSSGITKCWGQVVPINPREAVVPDGRIVSAHAERRSGLAASGATKSRGKSARRRPEAQALNRSQTK